MKYILNNDNLEVIGKQYLQGVGNYDGTNIENATDLATVITSGKQDKLVSGTNIKTINGNDITGSGNININDSGNYRLAEHGTSDTVYTLSSNTFHVWSVVPSLTITFGNESSGIANEYIFQFISGAEPTVLTLPDNIVWANDEIPEIESNYVYQISILNGYATLLKFKYYVDIKNYFRFVAVEDSSIALTSINVVSGEQDDTLDLQYSKDGTSWTQYDFNAIPLNAGETLYMKGNNPNGFSIMDMENGIGRGCFFGDPFGAGNGTTGKYECHGNIMSLLYGDDFEDKTIIPNNMCFSSMFSSCTGLTTAPELPATTLADSCYTDMFSNCTSLTAAPELPATTLANNCYYNMFGDCTSLVNAPELPAITLANNCYENMFYNCTSLTAAPELPATTLADSCYAHMFGDCTSLVNTPELPAITLANNCYEYMFYNCTSLTAAPELPATTLADSCYADMFSSCTGLTTAPELPATTLASYCYYRMFFGCTSLTTAPELPATTLAIYCYYYMFNGCTSLTTAPELLATTLTEDCYDSMFQGCSKLNKITMLATDISADNCLSFWVDGVASSGTFVKNAAMTSLPSGSSGIPVGWTVEDYVDSDL